MSANGGISLGFDKDVSWINEGYAAEPMVTTPPDFGQEPIL